MDTRLGGQHFLQTPGPSNVPEQVLRAMARPTIDHRGPEFAELTRGLLAKLQAVFQTRQPVIIYPSSGTGAWEAALVNRHCHGDRVLAAETGHFATLWAEMGRRFGLRMDLIPGDWRSGADPGEIAARLAADTSREIAAVTVVHNETSTGVTSRIPEIRAAMDRVGHPALLLVDTISSLASMDYRHDEWGVDVTVGCSQKGLMLPPGLGFNVVSDRARAAAKHAGLAKSYWDWDAIIASNRRGFFPYTPATNLLFGLDVACDMLAEEGLGNVFARHDRHAAATRAAVTAWGLEVQCANPAEYSSVLTAVVMPEGHDSNLVCRTSYEKYNMSLGVGLGRLNGRVFRIGHLGHFGDLSLYGTLAGVELTLATLGVPIKSGGVQAAMELLG